MNEDINVIVVPAPANFPSEPVFGFRGKSIEICKAWALQHQAKTVWVYRHKFGHEMYTAVRLVAAEGVTG